MIVRLQLDGDMSDWHDSQKQSSGNFRKFLQERVDKANLRLRLSAEEAKRLNKVKDVADKLRSGKNAKPSATNVTKPRVGVEIRVVRFTAVAKGK